MRRRDFILGGTAIVCPIAARAQQPNVPVVGLINLGSPDAYARELAAFRKGLNER